MKRNTNVTKEQFNEEVLPDFKQLARTVAVSNMDDMLFEMKNDLLSLAFQHLICSDFWKNLAQDRKKDLFNEYESLNYLLVDLMQFADKYPYEAGDVHDADLEAA